MWDVVAQRFVRTGVACGRCEACVSNRKQDYTGRMVAEAQTSGSVAFVTLTHARTPESFDYTKVQRFLKVFRKHLWEKHNQTKLRFFCVGERGDKYGRRHWHLILFFNKPYDIGRTKPNQKWQFWDHGWSTLEDLSHDHGRMVQKIRYCVMYAVKDLGDSDLPRARVSLKPALGSEYFQRHARELARIGGVPDGKYRFDGIVWDKGHRAGEKQSFTLTGAARRDYIEAFDDEWAKHHGPLKQCHGDWLDKHREIRFPWGVPQKAQVWWARIAAEVQRPAQYSRAPDLVRAAAEALTIKPKTEVKGHGARYIVGGAGSRKWACELIVTTDGTAFILADGAQFNVFYSVGEVLEIDPDKIRELDEWLKVKRGPQWKGPSWQDEIKAEKKAKRAARAAHLRAANLAEVERLRQIHGTAKEGHGIYYRGWPEKNPNPRASNSGQAFANPDNSCLLAEAVPSRQDGAASGETQKYRPPYKRGDNKGKAAR